MRDAGLENALLSLHIDASTEDVFCAHTGRQRWIRKLGIKIRALLRVCTALFSATVDNHSVGRERSCEVSYSCLAVMRKRLLFLPLDVETTVGRCCDQGVPKEPLSKGRVRQKQHVLKKQGEGHTLVCLRVSLRRFVRRGALGAEEAATTLCPFEVRCCLICLPETRRGPVQIREVE